MIQLVFACAVSKDGYAFGNKNELPWKHIKEDMIHFKETTESTIMIMGAKTFSSLPCKLKSRVHVVIADPSKGEPTTKNGEYPDVMYESLDYAVALVEWCDTKYDISIIGGAKILEEAAEYADTAVITTIMQHEPVEADVYIDLPSIISKFKRAKREVIKSDLDSTVMVEYYIRNEG